MFTYFLWRLINSYKPIGKTILLFIKLKEAFLSTNMSIDFLDTVIANQLL